MPVKRLKMAKIHARRLRHINFAKHSMSLLRQKKHEEIPTSTESTLVHLLKVSINKVLFQVIISLLFEILLHLNKHSEIFASKVAHKVKIGKLMYTLK